MSIPQPAAALTVRTVCRDTLKIIEHRAHRHFVQTVDLRIGAFKVTANLYIAVHRMRNDPLVLRLDIAAAQLQITKAVISETRPPFFHAFAFEDIFILLNTACRENTRGGIIHLPVFIQILAHLHDPVCSRGLLRADLRKARDVLAKINDPVSFFALLDADRFSDIDRAHRLHHLRNQPRRMILRKHCFFPAL